MTMITDRQVNNRFEELGVRARVCYSVLDIEIGLDDVLIPGAAVLEYECWGEVPYVRREVMNATVWDVVQFANDAITLSGDNHHTFLEDISKTSHRIRNRDVWRIGMGS